VWFLGEGGVTRRDREEPPTHRHKGPRHDGVVRPGGALSPPTPSRPHALDLGARGRSPAGRAPASSLRRGSRSRPAALEGGARLGGPVNAMSAHRGDGPTPHGAANRWRPSGCGGMGPSAALRLLDDGRASPSSARLASGPMASATRPTRLLPRAPSAPAGRPSPPPPAAWRERARPRSASGCGRGPAPGPPGCSRRSSPRWSRRRAAGSRPGTRRRRR